MTFDAHCLQTKDLRGFARTFADPFALTRLPSKQAAEPILIKDEHTPKRKNHYIVSDRTPSTEAKGPGQSTQKRQDDSALKHQTPLKQVSLMGFTRVPVPISFESKVELAEEDV